VHTTFPTGIFPRAGLAAILLLPLAVLVAGTPAPAAAQYRQKIGNDLAQCYAGAGPSVMVTVDGVKSSRGKMRVQSYRATPEDWMKKGRWIYRIEAPAREGTMTFCMPVPKAGSYGIAIRHDVDGDNDTDIFGDGGGMSNNPSINIFNLGKPSYKKTSVTVGDDVLSIRIRMRYM
jgi:uncharacterized protein (DUF2141 family)